MFNVYISIYLYIHILYLYIYKQICIHIIKAYICHVLTDIYLYIFT